MHQDYDLLVCTYCKKDGPKLKVESVLISSIDVMSLLKSISAIVAAIANCCTQTIGTTITENLF